MSDVWITISRKNYPCENCGNEIGAGQNVYYSTIADSLPALVCLPCGEHLGYESQAKESKRFKKSRQERLVI